MKVYPDCLPCFLKQILNVSKIAGLSRKKTMSILKESCVFLGKNLKEDASPGHNATLLHRLFKEKTQIDDPYKTLKDKYNDIALRLEPFLFKEIYEPAENKLAVAIKLAALGNVIDFGIPRQFDLNEEIKNFFQIPFAYFDMAIFERFLVPGKTVLYVADNAGEIVFDKFLLRELKERGLKVILAVRGGPILNDATVEDALKTGAAEIADELITTGKDFIGVDFEFVSEEFKEYWNKAFFVVSKGQANFETLDGIRDADIFFILKAKCPPVAKELNCNVNDLIFLYNKHLLEIKENESNQEG